jgi:hypothetical protein
MHTAVSGQEPIRIDFLFGQSDEKFRVRESISGLVSGQRGTGDAKFFGKLVLL